MNRERSDKMEEEKKEKKGFFARLVSGLTKTRDNIVSGIDSVFHGFSHIDDDFYEEIEEILIMGDLGVHATEAILDKLKERVKEEKRKGGNDMERLSIKIKDQDNVVVAVHDLPAGTTLESGVVVLSPTPVQATITRAQLEAQIVKLSSYETTVGKHRNLRNANCSQPRKWRVSGNAEIL